MKWLKQLRIHSMKCITPDCNGEENSRGLCRACYAIMHDLVKSGKVTKEQLVADGKLLEVRKKPRKVSKRMSWFLLGTVAEK